MEKKRKTLVTVGVSLLAAFVLWTLLVRFVDLKPIGPNGSTVGFATLNGFFHSLTGVHMWLYNLTDWLGLVPIGTAACFGVLGLVQWIRRKSIFAVDNNIFLLGAFYIIVIAVYALFEIVVINYRPILINQCLEVSYPSSTTMLVTCVMPTAIIQLWARIKNRYIKVASVVVISVFIAFMVIGRVVSGVHWITDIIGGALFSIGLVSVYFGLFTYKK